MSTRLGAANGLCVSLARLNKSSSISYASPEKHSASDLKMWGRSEYELIGVDVRLLVPLQGGRRMAIAFGVMSILCGMEEGTFFQWPSDMECLHGITHS